MEAVKDASHLYESSAGHAPERPGFRINEISDLAEPEGALALSQQRPDAFYVRRAGSGSSCATQEEVRLGPGETFSVAPKRPHLVVTAARSRRPSSCCRAGRIRLRPADVPP